VDELVAALATAVVDGVYLGSAPLRRQRRQIADVALVSPGVQGRRTHALAAHQRADLAGLGAAVGCRQNAAFVSTGKMPTPSMAPEAVGNIYSSSQARINCNTSIDFIY
jgi:hypothetical protein